MNKSIVEELESLIRAQVIAEERQKRSERIKIGLRLRRERLAREKELLAQEKAKH